MKPSPQKTAKHPCAAKRREELLAELEQARARVSRSARELAHDVNLVQHVRESIDEHKTGWLTGAAVTGGLLSLFFRRPWKKRGGADKAAGHSRGALGAALALLGVALKVAQPVLQPMLTSLLTRKLTQRR